MLTKRNEKIIALYGNSTDEKPIEDIANGSIFEELDTKTTYIFDEENKQ